MKDFLITFTDTSLFFLKSRTNSSCSQSFLCCHIHEKEEEEEEGLLTNAKVYIHVTIWIKVVTILYT